MSFGKHEYDANQYSLLVKSAQLDDRLWQKLETDMHHLEVGDFKAWITSNGRRVEQFSVDHDRENNTVSCWIAGDVKAEFTVHWRCTDPRDASSGK